MGVGRLLANGGHAWPPGYGDIREIPGGGLFQVVLARRERDGKEVVLKRPRPDRPESELALRLRREQALLQRLNLDGVIKVVDVEESPAGPVVVFERSGQRTLAERVRERPCSVAEFLDIGARLAEVVELVHQHDVLHRMLSPHKIILDSSSQPTIVGFEFATTASGAVAALEPPAELESELTYIAPEQTGRTNRAVDRRADLYALGAIFYEMLTGSPPFRDEDPPSLIHAHLARTPVPPTVLNPAVPALLSTIVLKLLSKEPEDRYQSAEALAADLHEARRRWRNTSEIATFLLGTVDLERELPLSETLHGRDAEREQLTAALTRARAEGSFLVALVGPAGVGKSAMLRDLESRLGQRDRFLYGKFESMVAVPYAGWVAAFRPLVRALLAEGPQATSSRRQRVLDAIGPNSGALADLVPDLEKLIGPFSKLTTGDPADAENRLALTLRSFIGALAGPDRVLVICLDDIQWIDSASLKLLQRLIAGSDLHHILMVVAYRGEEVGTEHPVAQALTAAREAGTPMATLEVRPLGEAPVAALLAEALHASVETVRPLARVLVQRTGGIPLFVRNFLRHLHRTKKLTFELATGTWRWELAQIEAAPIGEDVTALLLAAMRRLPPETARLISVASCLGSRFDLWLLSAVSGSPIDETSRSLGHAISEGLLVAIAERPQFEPPIDFEAADPAAVWSTYRFAHDRVQEAAAALLAEADRKELHRVAARVLRRALSPEGIDRHLFAVLDQLDNGGEKGADSGERRVLTDLYGRAGQRARAGAAFAAARHYFRRAIELLPEDIWQADLAQATARYRDAAEASHLAGDFAGSQGLASEALSHSPSPVDVASLQGVLRTAATLRGDFPEAINCALAALRTLGIDVPPHPPPESLPAEIAATRAMIGARCPADLLDVPPARRAEDCAAIEAFAAAFATAWSTEPILMAFLTLRAVQFMLRFGLAPQSATIFGNYGMLLGQYGDYGAAFEYMTLGAELGRRFPESGQEPSALGLLASFGHFWRRPLRETLPFVDRSRTLAIHSGSLLIAGYVWTTKAEHMLFLGEELPRVLGECESGLTFIHAHAHATAGRLLLVVRQSVRCLRGQTAGRGRFDDAEFDEERFLVDAAGGPSVPCLYRIMRLQSAFLLGDRPTSLKLVGEIAAAVWNIGSSFCVVEYALYAGLTLADAADSRAGDDRAALSADIAVHAGNLERWATLCPQNFRHKHLLLAAEQARLAGRFVEALRLYDEAAEGAGRERFRQDQALANERAGRLLLALGSRGGATTYLRAALSGYSRWGATAKVDQLLEEFPALSAERWSAVGGAPIALDLRATLRAAETVSSEMDLERVIQTIMAVCLETAGAARAVLIVTEDDLLRVRAFGGTDEPVSLVDEPLSASDRAPRAIVEHVSQSRDPLVLGDATRDARFATDDYVTRHHTRSVLAVPLRRPDRLIGVLYLENDLLAQAFAPDRVTSLGLLSSAIATALENSRLFEKLKTAEAKVRFLSDASALLSESLDIEQTLSRVAHLSVPFLADVCVIDVVHGEEAHRTAVAHIDPSKESFLCQLGLMYPTSRGSRTPMARVLATGEPFEVSDMAPGTLGELTEDERERVLVRRIERNAVTFLPLSARGRIVGLIGFGRSTSGTGAKSGVTDSLLARELARRVALAIDNARLYRETQAAVHVRDDFLAVASHELRTPLTPVRLQISSLLRSVRGVARPVAQQDFIARLEVAERQVGHLEKLIEELLDVSRIRGGRLTLHRERVNLVAVVQKVLDRFAPESARAGCTITLRAPAAIEGAWDEMRLDQITTNLLSNALKFGRGAPIEVSVEQSDDVAALRVRDHGVGVAPADQARIFERFERATSMRHHGGLGLGLWITTQIVGALGGHIAVESTPGQGALFSVDLPLGAVTAVANGSPPVALPGAGS